LLKKSEHKREEPRLGEPKLVHPDSAVEITIAQELAGERVADTLIRARQQLGQDLRSIAEVLCIRYSYLDAIERGQYENLPGPTYAVGFMRSYADYLGLDGDQIVDRFKKEVDGLDSQTKLHFPTPAPEGKMPGGAVFLVAALLFAGAYGVWFYLSNQSDGLGGLVAPVPEQLQQMVDDGTTSSDSAMPATSTPAAPAPTAPQADSPIAEPQAAVEPAPVPAPAPAAPAATPSAAVRSATTPPPSATPAAPTPSAPDSTGAAAAAAPTAPATQNSAALRQPGVQPAPAAPAAGQEATTAEPEAPAAEAPAVEAPAGDTTSSSPYAIPAAPESSTPATAFVLNHQPTVYGEENADARIVLKATQDAWVQVRDREGNLLLTRVLRVGDSYRVPNQSDLTLLTGNAGGLEITVDGSALPALGPVGAVRRNIPLEPEALRSGAGRQP
jgi:cytoskeletal protein RodZ